MSLQVLAKTRKALLLGDKIHTSQAAASRMDGTAPDDVYRHMHFCVAFIVEWTHAAILTAQGENRIS